MITGWCIAGQHNTCPVTIRFSQQNTTLDCACPKCHHERDT